jgi:exosome complex component MTR3
LINHSIQDAEDRSLSLAIYQALVPAVRLELLPKSTIDVFITVVEADGIDACIAAATTAASTALADAGIEMIGLVTSCSAVRNIFLGEEQKFTLLIGHSWWRSLA